MVLGFTQWSFGHVDADDFVTSPRERPGCVASMDRDSDPQAVQSTDSPGGVKERAAPGERQTRLASGPAAPVTES